MSGPQFRSRPAISYPISCHSFSLKVSFRLNFSFPFFMSKNVCPCKQNVCNFKSCQNQFCMYDINRVMYKLYHPQIYMWQENTLLQALICTIVPPQSQCILISGFYHTIIYCCFLSLKTQETAFTYTINKLIFFFIII